MSKIKNKYTPKYFKDNMPEWKRIKDPLTTRYFYRPISFITASLAANLKISANTISYASILIAILACIFFLIPNHSCNIIGAILVSVWAIFDATDGNLARSVKKQPFGEFADGISSYILVAFLCTVMGISVYLNGGLIIDKECIWIVLLGALASSSDTLMRLIYQKYKASERALADDGKLQIEYDKRTNTSQTNSLIVRIEADFGIGGILPLLILFGTVLNFLDLVVIYCFIYYFFSGIVMNCKYIFKSIKRTKELESNN